MNPRSADLARSANLVVRRLLAVEAGEQVALVCDPDSEMSMAHALAGVVEDVGGEYTMLVMPSRTTAHKNDLTPVIERALEAADCLIGLTGSCGAPTYSKVVKHLLDEKRLRALSMVMRSMENYTGGGARANYDELRVEGEKLAAIWSRAHQIRVTSRAGTDLSAEVSGEAVIVECGFATEPGQEAAFSDGEVSQMPGEGEAEGVVVVDGPIAHIGLPDTPIILRVAAGKVTSVEGDCRQATELREIVETVPHADNIAEIGIGLNPACRRNGDFEEEKKARGLVHVAIGDNVFYGGRVESPVHIDMVMYQPSVRLGDELVVDQGSMRLS